MSKVYIIQNTHRLNRDTSVLEPKYDFEPAKRFGELIFLLTPSAKPHDPTVIAELLDKLGDFTEHDHLLLVGNPALIGFSCAIASDVTEGRLKVLQWDGKAKDYVSIAVDLWGDRLRRKKDSKVEKKHGADCECSFCRDAYGT